MAAKMVTNNKKKPGFAVIHLMVLIFPFTFTALLKILRKQLLFIKYFLPCLSCRKATILACYGYMNPPDTKGRCP